MKRLLFNIIMCALGLLAKAQNTYVVSVGIADYAYIDDLRSTERDVAMFSEVMRHHTANVVTLTGSAATHQAVFDKLSSVFSRAKADDIVVFYFSGHGMPGGFCCYDTRSERTALTYKELQQVFRNCKARRKIVFADACYSGGLRSSRNSASSSNTMKNSNVMFFLSSRTNETSIERGPNGLYTQFLVGGLRGAADANRDRVITARELYDYVHNSVVSSSRQEQHPVMWGKFDSSMKILDWR